MRFDVKSSKTGLAIHSCSPS